MEPQNENETASAKEVIGVRANPSLKFQLAEEAAALNISLSDYASMILSNRNTEDPELQGLKEQVKNQQTEIGRLTKDLAAAKQPVAQAPTILYDERLLFLFEKLKGQSDTVKNAFGEDFDITYNYPYDVLIAIIYSTKTKT